jgi:5-hydroxyisourate hydrolase
MSRITTHVLDTVLGRPAAGVAIRLAMQEGGGWMEVSTGENPAVRVHDAPGEWTTISDGITDKDGRCSELGPDAREGVYRLTFNTGDYLALIGRTSIYPEISITFICAGDAHYHLPLLLSDNCYTTYRGS